MAVTLTKLTQRARTLVFGSRARRIVTLSVLGVGLAAGAAWLWINLATPPSLAELERRAKDAPLDADVAVDLGHARFAAGRQTSALASYERALSLDADAADERMLTNLVACYGDKEQGAAHALIVKHKLVAVAEKLDDLTRNKVWRVRTGAMATLEKLGRASQRDYLNVWTTDLESPECDVRRYAVERLGELGDKRALTAIRAAKQKDADVPWYSFRCLGGRADKAEERILASR